MQNIQREGVKVISLASASERHSAVLKDRADLFKDWNEIHCKKQQNGSRQHYRVDQPPKGTAQIMWPRPGMSMNMMQERFRPEQMAAQERIFHSMGHNIWNGAKVLGGAFGVNLPRFG